MSGVGHVHVFRAFWSHWGPYGPVDAHYHPCTAAEPGECAVVLAGPGKDCGGPFEVVHAEITLPASDPENAEALKRIGVGGEAVSAEVRAPNTQLVGRDGLGRIRIAFPSVVMTREQALTHAAWLVSLADDNDEFAAYLAAVRNT